jgi:hypothetical protein
MSRFASNSGNADLRIGGHAIRLLALVVVLCTAMVAQMTWTAAQVIDFVRTSAKKNPDKQVAEYLRKVTLTDRLSDDAIEACIQVGAGPLTQKALIELAGKSAGLPQTKTDPKKTVTASAAAAQPARVGPPPPSDEEKQQVLEKVTEYARNYIKNLPNFTCTQVTKRFVDPSNAEHYQLEDTVLENLSYSEGRESYKVVSVNNTPSTKGHRELGGTTSEGEFGTDMNVLFTPDTRTDFQWERWTTWNGRRTHVFAYRVLQSNSSWSVEYEKTQRTVPGYKGFVYVDRDLNMIMRITREAEDIPADFPIQNVKQDTRYEFQKIGDRQQEFLVPSQSVITSKTGRYMVKNEATFRLYRKFGTESVIKFGDAEDPKPEPPPAKKQN